MDKQFKTYLENIIELEKNAYLQRETIEELEQRINRLGHTKYISRTEVTREADWVLNLLTIGFVCVPGGAIIYGIKGLFSDFISGAISGIFKGAIIGLVIAAVISVVKYLIDKSKEDETQERWDTSYYQEKNADDKRVASENEVKARLIALRNELNKQYDKTQATLEQYYNVGVLYQKYHTMNAVCSIYEYFMSGRCTELTGHEGAYNLYESELRSNLIISKLDDILVNLESIKSRQFMLYSAISEGNKKMDSLLSESERQTKLASFTAEQSAIAAYNSAEASRELNQLKWLKTYEIATREY